MVEVVKARDVQYIGKDRRPVIHVSVAREEGSPADLHSMPIKPTSFAWKCKSAICSVESSVDMPRLLEHGGIYLDIDTFILRPFAPASIMEYDMVMGMEASVSTAGTIEEIEPKGLCNAIMAARPGAVFIERWLQSYDSFDDVQWADHSVVSTPLVPLGFTDTARSCLGLWPNCIPPPSLSYPLARCSGHYGRGITLQPCTSRTTGTLRHLVS